MPPPPPLPPLDFVQLAVTVTALPGIVNVVSADLLSANCTLSSVVQPLNLYPLRSPALIVTVSPSEYSPLPEFSAQLSFTVTVFDIFFITSAVCGVEVFSAKSCAQSIITLLV